MLIVVIIVGILAGIIVPRYGEVSARQEVRNSRDAFVWFAARARATAIETGQEVRVYLDTPDSRAVMWAGGAAIDSLDFGALYQARIETDPDLEEVEICYTTRGVASLSCGTGSTVLIHFNRAGLTSSARLWAMGQVERL